MEYEKITEKSGDVSITTEKSAAVHFLTTAQYVRLELVRLSMECHGGEEFCARNTLKSLESYVLCGDEKKNL